MTPDISCRCVIQIGLQIPRWLTKWRPCKGMAVSQAFMFHVKWYSLLHFAVCQLLCWLSCCMLLEAENMRTKISVQGLYHVLRCWFFGIESGLGSVDLVLFPAQENWIRSSNNTEQVIHVRVSANQSINLIGVGKYVSAICRVTIILGG